VDPLVPAWKARPTTGITEGNITDDGLPVDHADVRITGLADSATVTDGLGWRARRTTNSASWC